MGSPSPEITVLISESAAGHEPSRNELLKIVYAELKQRAHQQRGRWHGNLTMNTTALVHESYIKLMGPNASSFKNRGHFMATASRAMRQVLVDYARKSQAERRGGQDQRVDSDPETWMALPDGLTDEILDLHRTLEKLEVQYPDLARVVECRVFAGLDVNETADCLEIGTATVKRRWAMATSWMEKEMSGSLNVQPS